jgi:hypothetical protein
MTYHQKSAVQSEKFDLFAGDQKKLAHIPEMLPRSAGAGGCC